ncbi:SDR family oxidoreductase [Williamsia sterculiae]|uniref:NADP-dependent 3-hydroxy acid dehydrogenase YdfG n=1 Tax=Williamsia sterculiae TaxID=1344003 RepID=A0A1N7EQT2_9NOCA|nr:SDR family oxidoreductase [Williamsia sterculiae]SIR90420.1 NADP-dependent 3-hydroxy acid dehydrogenase YdfG [Williamsia sterculiae]
MNVLQLFRTRRSPASLRDRVVVITGAARGIGAATATAFAGEGARVWIADIDDDVAEATAARIGGHRVLHLDVTDRESWAAAVAAVIDRDGTIDVLVNNAGVMPLGAFTEEDEATTELILDVNVRGVLNGMRAVLPSMTSVGRGHIVNIASMAGKIPIPGMVTYNASKYAALGASLAARREYDGTGVDVCAVLPSAVRTELSSGAQLGGGMPTVDPDDVADAVVRTLTTRAAITSVPGWVSPAWALVDAFVPESVERRARGLVDDRRALRTDAAARQAYTDRIGRQAADHSGAGSMS